MWILGITRVWPGQVGFRPVDLLWVTLGTTASVVHSKADLRHPDALSTGISTGYPLVIHRFCGRPTVTNRRGSRHGPSRSTGLYTALVHRLWTTWGQRKSKDLHDACLMRLVSSAIWLKRDRRSVICCL